MTTTRGKSLEEMKMYREAEVTHGCAELYRSQRGWLNPTKNGLGDFPRLLDDDYYPGDIGFDPFGLKPEGAVEFAEMQTKELQHGRLAMLAIAGFVAQELVDGAPIL